MPKRSSGFSAGVFALGACRDSEEAPNTVPSVHRGLGALTRLPAAARGPDCPSLHTTMSMASHPNDDGDLGKQ